MKYKLPLLFLSALVFTLFTFTFYLQKPKKPAVNLAAQPGDCQGNDGDVDILDFQALSNTFAKSPGDPGYNAACNFNSDPMIEILDYQLLSNNFGHTGVTATPAHSVTPIPTTSGDPVIMANSDIICTNMGSPSATSCNHMAVSQIIFNQRPHTYLVVGDLCHEPTAACFNNFYNPSYGRFKSITKPVTGNHEYLTSHATTFFDYFNGTGVYSGIAGDRDKGYYGFDMGSWHLVALNSQCSEVGGCGTTSAQYRWLENDLRSHNNRCTLAYYHIPVFSSGGRANNNMLEIFRLLYNYNAEIVLDGHDHIYERFAPQNPSGTRDTTRGIREFIVGTGGANHTSITQVAANSEVRNADTFGALKLTLHPNSYDWQFVPVSGSGFSDTGSTMCH